MRSTLLFTTLSILLLCACGISPEERQAIQQAALDRKAAQDSVAALVTRMDASYTETKQARVLAIAELEAAKVTLERVKGWQFGRSRYERDEQIKSTSIHVQRIEAVIAEMDSFLVLTEKAKEETIRKAKYMEDWAKAIEAGQ